MEKIYINAVVKGKWGRGKGPCHTVILGKEARWVGKVDDLCSLCEDQSLAG